MSGWRIGMLASNPQFIEWILKVKSNIDSGMFRPLQMAATKALSCGQEWYDQLNEVYRNRRDIAEKIMKALGCSYEILHKQDCSYGEKFPIVQQMPNR